MKKMAVLVGLVMLLALAGVVGCGGGGSDGSGNALSPEDTVKSCLEALAPETLDKWFSYLVDNEGNRESYEDVKRNIDGVDSMEISIMKTKLVEQTTDEAIVEVSYDTKFNAGGNTIENSFKERFFLVQSDGKWLIENNEEIEE